MEDISSERSKKEVDALYDALVNGDIGKANELIRSMGENKNGLAVEPLTILVDYDDETVRGSAAMALGRIGDRSAVEPLIKALKDPSTAVQTNAAIALGNIGDMRAIEALEAVYVTQEMPALTNAVRKAVNRLRTGDRPDKKLYLSEPETPPEAKEPETIAPNIGSIAVGVKNRLFILIGVGIFIILMLVVASFAYTALFPPVWAEELPYKNSSGQFQSVVIYRNATDASYETLARFLEAENASMKGDLFDETGTKCLEYAARLHDDAERAQINCSIIGTELSGNVPGHAVVAFNTKDSGLVYVDPWSTNVSQADLGQISLDRVVFLRDKWKQVLPVRNTRGENVVAVEYRNAGPVTYDRLMAFLSNDTTEFSPYVDPDYTCSDFAVHLHDAAEEQGIKCAIVRVIFANDTPSHAFNAFDTVDKGIVYIDDTGLNSSEKELGGLALDGVVYLLPGQELGELPANQTNGSLDYGYYVQRKDTIQGFVKELEAYVDEGNYFIANTTDFKNKMAQFEKDKASLSRELDEYNAAVAEYNSRMYAHNDAVDRYNAGDHSVSIPPAPTNLNELEARGTRLKTYAGNLDSTAGTLENERKFLKFRADSLMSRYDELMAREELKLYINRPTGIVEDVSVYW